MTPPAALASYRHGPGRRPPTLLWDVFCQVIDNFGDIGVCWRLCSDLAARGHRVRLWVDDATTLTWMAPGAIEGQHPGIRVLPWAQSGNPAYLANLPTANVWIEAFGCQIATEFIANSAYSTGAKRQYDQKMPVWINLEYLSAESFVDRSHGLPSPVMHGPAKGWIKHFFYPGFTARTGGLLREPGLMARRAAFDGVAWLRQLGIASRPDEQRVSLFCYEPPALPRLLRQLSRGCTPTHLLVTPGRAATAVKTAIHNNNDLKPSLNRHSLLSISYLPTLTQIEFDHLLWACDLNFVRGEDSLVRAIWAGAPFVWHIYPQSDGAHGPKLQALLDMMHANADVRELYQAWNGMQANSDPMNDPAQLLPWPEPTAWVESVQAMRSRLVAQDDLCTALVQFVLKNR